MRKIVGIAMVLLGTVSVAWSQGSCKTLDSGEARRFLPDRVPLEAETIPVDTRGFAAVEFPDKTRIAIAPLITSGYDAAIQQKYAFVFVTETRLLLGRWSIPAGMVGLGLEPAEPNAPMRYLIARDFSGAEIDRICLLLDAEAPPVRLALVPKGEKGFELRIGKYVIDGKQR